MELSSSRLQLRLVAAGYALVALASALLIFQRYLLYVRYPQDVAAAGGMYAGGDLLLEFMICLMFLVPTIALVIVIRKSEAACTTYAKVLLGISCTAPISLGLMFVPALNQWYWGNAFIFRLFAAPLVFGVLIFSRWLTRFARARRLISYAMLVEGLTVAGMVATLFISFTGHHG
jgi:hypothetical protein